MPNIGVFSRPVFDKLVDHPDFIDRTKYGQTAPNPAMATRRIIAEILELEEVLVMDAVYNTSPESAPGPATPISPPWARPKPTPSSAA